MKKGILWFVVVLVVIALFIATSINGLNLGTFEIPSASEGVRLGLDLAGGASITFEARTEDGSAPSAADMETTKAIFRERLDGKGYTEATIQKVGDKRFTVEIPTVTDPEEAIALLGKPAVLEFRDADGNVVIEGKDVADAVAQYGQVSDVGISQHHVALKLNSDARAKFKEATKQAASRASEGKNYIGIYLDGTAVSVPYVDASYASTGIDSDEAIITFGDEGSTAVTGGAAAEELANFIRSGALPFELEEIELRSVGPTLGEKALETSLFAGLLGLLLVMLFMIIIYRLPGLVAAFSLAFYAALMLVVMALIKVNLSLPGIAGIILSIGMAVDANVVIYERIKEELRLGKTLKASIDAGFKRAFTAILDSNVTTLIAAVVLYAFGMGTIKGFAVTLGLGVIISMFTVLVVSRFLLYRLVDMKIKSPKAYGA